MSSSLQDLMETVLKARDAGFNVELAVKLILQQAPPSAVIHGQMIQAGNDGSYRDAARAVYAEHLGLSAPQEGLLARQAEVAAAKSHLAHMKEDLADQKYRERWAAEARVAIGDVEP